MNANANEFYGKLRNNQQIKTQRVYSVQEVEMKNENSGWEVLLDANESVHSVQFGTFPLKHKRTNNKNKRQKKIITPIIKTKVDENLDTFLNESSEEELSETNEMTEEEIEIKSILKRTKYQSVATT